MFIEKVILMLNFFKRVIISVNDKIQHDSVVFNSNTFREVTEVFVIIYQKQNSVGIIKTYFEIAIKIIFIILYLKLPSHSLLYIQGINAQ